MCEVFIEKKICIVVLLAETAIYVLCKEVMFLEHVE